MSLPLPASLAIFLNVRIRFSPDWIASSSIPVLRDMASARSFTSPAVTFAAPPVDLRTASVCLRTCSEFSNCLNEYAAAAPRTDSPPVIVFRPAVNRRVLVSTSTTSVLIVGIGKSLEEGLELGRARGATLEPFLHVRGEEVADLAAPALTGQERDEVVGQHGEPGVDTLMREHGTIDPFERRPFQEFAGRHLLDHLERLPQRDRYSMDLSAPGLVPKDATA